MAMNATEARQMITACEKAGVQLSVGYRLYFEPHHLEMRRLAAEKTFGHVKVIESGLGFTVPGPNSWRLDKKIGGGGAIMDLGIYAIQGARRTINLDPINVTAQAFTFDKEHFKDIHETVFWQFEFPGGTIAHCGTTYSSYVDRLYATCERGWFKLEPSFNATGAQGHHQQGRNGGAVTSLSANCADGCVCPVHSDENQTRSIGRRRVERYEAHRGYFAGCRNRTKNSARLAELAYCLLIDFTFRSTFWLAFPTGLAFQCELFL